MERLVIKPVNKIARLFLVAGMCVALLGCSTASDQTVSEINDPFESLNRGMFAVNDALDQAIAEPVARGYREVVPKSARRGIHNFLINLKSPVFLANQILQGDLEGAGNVLMRVTVNTFVGIGGLFDVAGSEGFEHEHEDFGQTLAVWGIDHGPYLVLPLFGPSSFRDATGLLVDAFADPVRLYLFNTDQENLYYARVVMSGIDRRESLLEVLDDLRKSSIDYYAAVRSAYYQRREALVNDEDPDAMDGPEIPDYDDFEYGDCNC